MLSLATPDSATLARALLQWLLALTAISSAALLLILPLRPLLRRLGGPALAYAAWALLPLALLASLLPHPAAPMAMASVSIIATPADPGPATVLTPEQPLLSDSTWLALWLAGAALLLAAMALQQWRFQRALGPLRRTRQPRVLHTQCTGTGPLVLGLLRPRIVLPADFRQRYSGPERALVLAHEAAHLRHGDLAVNALAAGIQVLFWFNPLVHLAAARLRLDQELACDAAVVRRHPHRRQAYANAMLKTQLAAQLGSTPAPLACHWQPRHPLKERIMQLTRPTPARAQRRAMKTLLLATALAGGYGAWAAVADLDAVPLLTSEPAMAAPASATATPAPPAVAATPTVAATPAVAASPVAQAAPARDAQRAPAAAPASPAAPSAATPEATIVIEAPAIASQGNAATRANESVPTQSWLVDTGQAKDGSPRYQVAMEHKSSLAGTTRTNNFTLALAANESATVTLNDGARQCKLTLKVNPRGDKDVALDMPVACDGEEARHPRVVTELGRKAIVEFGSTGGTVQRFTMVVTAPGA